MIGWRRRKIWWRLGWRRKGGGLQTALLAVAALGVVFGANVVMSGLVAGNLAQRSAEMSRLLDYGEEGQDSPGQMRGYMSRRLVGGQVWTVFSISDPRPEVLPPGVEAWPAVGQAVVSPALRQYLAQNQDDELVARTLGEVEEGEIARPGLISDGELVSWQVVERIDSAPVVGFGRNSAIDTIAPPLSLGQIVLGGALTFAGGVWLCRAAGAMRRQFWQAAIAPLWLLGVGRRRLRAIVRLDLFAAAVVGLPLGYVAAWAASQVTASFTGMPYVIETGVAVLGVALLALCGQVAAVGAWAQRGEECALVAEVGGGSAGSYSGRRASLLYGVFTGISALVAGGAIVLWCLIPADFSANQYVPFFAVLLAIWVVLALAVCRDIPSRARHSRRLAGHARLRLILATLQGNRAALRGAILAQFLLFVSVAYVWTVPAVIAEGHTARGPAQLYTVDVPAQDPGVVAGLLGLPFAVGCAAGGVGQGAKLQIAQCRQQGGDISSVQYLVGQDRASLQRFVLAYNRVLPQRPIGWGILEDTNYFGAKYALYTNLTIVSILALTCAFILVLAAVMILRRCRGFLRRLRDLGVSHGQVRKFAAEVVIVPQVVLGGYCLIIALLASAVFGKALLFANQDFHFATAVLIPLTLLWLLLVAISALFAAAAAAQIPGGHPNA